MKNEKNNYIFLHILKLSGGKLRLIQLHFEKTIFNLRVWYRIPEKKKKYPIYPDGDDNPDIEDYLGYGDLKIMYPYKDNLISSLIRFNPKTKKGAIEITAVECYENNLINLLISPPNNLIALFIEV